LRFSNSSITTRLKIKDSPRPYNRKGRFSKKKYIYICINMAISSNFQTVCIRRLAKQCELRTYNIGLFVKHLRRTVVHAEARRLRSSSKMSVYDRRRSTSVSAAMFRPYAHVVRLDHTVVFVCRTSVSAGLRSSSRLRDVHHPAASRVLPAGDSIRNLCHVVFMKRTRAV